MVRHKLRDGAWFLFVIILLVGLTYTVGKTEEDTHKCRGICLDGAPP